MADKAPEIVYGAAAVAQCGTEDLKDRLAVLQKHNTKVLDTASVYVRTLLMATSIKNSIMTTFLARQ